MKTIIKLVVAALVVHATFRAGTVYLRYYNFRDDVHQIAQFAGRATDNELVNRVLEAAQQREVPIDPGVITVRRPPNHLLIDGTYSERIELLPRYFYPWQFKLDVDVLTISP